LELPQLPVNQLDEPFSEEEVRSAIAEMLDEKAPGPDGFTGVYYRTCWEIIKNEVMAAFHCFYNQTAWPLTKLNGALLSLIPKSEVPSCRVHSGRSV
jgi:hypothetical protein